MRALIQENETAITIADEDGDGFVSEREWADIDWQLRRYEENIDTDGDRELSDEEITAFGASIGIDLADESEFTEIENPLLRQHGAQLASPAREASLR